MRGEYAVMIYPGDTTRELPPHARRIRPLLERFFGRMGTTSACAENTINSWGLGLNPWNYLRMRGEYTVSGRNFFLSLELPPHARRIPGKHAPKHRQLGTTSACAENTIFLTLIHVKIRNYLRMRGEYLNAIGDYPEPVELPPHARRIQDRRQAARSPIGTTSACAENT